MSKDNLPAGKTDSKEVDAFLNAAAMVKAGDRAASRGRLMFAIDATASRQHTWDLACHLQASMFEATKDIGGLDIQVAFFRGFNEFRASPWTSDGADLARRMGGVSCMAGRTQIAKVLQHALNEAAKGRMSAVIYVGDCVEEDVDELGHLSGKMGVIGVPIFVFHEGSEPNASFAFKQMAKLSGGVYCSFDPGAPDRLKALLGAVAVYASGGRQALLALAQQGDGNAKALARQLALEHKGAGGR